MRLIANLAFLFSTKPDITISICDPINGSGSRNRLDFESKLVQPGSVAPLLVQPGSVAPLLVQPGSVAPLLVQPGSVAPLLVQPGSVAPLLVQPGSVAPLLVQPGSVAPLLVQPGSVAPLLVQPGSVTPLLNNPLFGCSIDVLLKFVFCLNIKASVVKQLSSIFQTVAVYFIGMQKRIHRW